MTTGFFIKIVFLVMAPTALIGTLSVLTKRPVVGKPLCVQMTISNVSSQEIEVISPEFGMPPTYLDWKASNKAYQISVLTSIGLLKMKLENQDKHIVESKGLIPWVNPIVGFVKLKPQTNLNFEFDLNEHYVIDSPGAYNLELRYGNDSVFVVANTSIKIK